MTDVEAQVLRENWAKWGDATCRHKKLELESTEEGELTGNYHCGDCGAPVAKKSTKKLPIESTEEGRSNMASPRLKVRPEVHDYLQSSEQLLSIAAAAQPPLSEAELRIVKHYAEEVSKLVALRAKI